MNILFLSNVECRLSIIHLSIVAQLKSLKFIAYFRWLKSWKEFNILGTCVVYCWNWNNSFDFYPKIECVMSCCFQCTVWYQTSVFFSNHSDWIVLSNCLRHTNNRHIGFHERAKTRINLHSRAKVLWHQHIDAYVWYQTKFSFWCCQRLLNKKLPEKPLSFLSAGVTTIDSGIQCYHESNSDLMTQKKKLSLTYFHKWFRYRGTWTWIHNVNWANSGVVK